MKIRGTTIATPIARHAVTDDSCVSEKTWSSQNIVDKLCPSFTESGAVVACEPFEGTPLEVITEISYEDGLVTNRVYYLVTYDSDTGEYVETNEIIDDPGGEPYGEYTTGGVEVWFDGAVFYYGQDETHYVFPGLTLTRCGKNLVDDVAFFTERGFTLQEDGRWKGTSVKTFTLFRNVSGATGQFAFSMDAEKWEGQEGINSIAIVVYYTDGTIGYNYPGNQTGSRFKMQTRADKVLQSIVWSYAKAGTFYVKDMQIEYGDTATEYEPYIGQTYTADFGDYDTTYLYGSYNWTTGVLTDADNDRIEVQFEPNPMSAHSGVNTFISTTGETTVKGKKDPIKIIETLTNAIIALGGTV